MEIRPRWCLALLWVFSTLTAAVGRRSLSPAELDALENMCELQTLANVTYCYCDLSEPNEATISDCWIYGDTKRNDTLWDTFHHQRRLHRLTINLRGDGTLDFVPSRVLTYTPQLWTLTIKNAAITRVRSEAFSDSQSLARLILTSNGITHLGKHAFSDLSNLTRLNLGENKIAALGRHVFHNLPKLKQLYLDRNALTKIRGGAFAGLDNLQALELFDNRLEEVGQGTFRGLKQLERLDLHRNILETIEDRTFSALSNLRELDLEANRIKYISEKGLSGLKNLMKLNLYNNKLLSILPGTFQETPGLFFLDIHQNVLDTLEEEAFSPIMNNLRNITMYLFVQDNALRCDCQLAWLLRLRAETASTHVQTALDTAVCHMEGGSLPARLETVTTVDPALETSTLGIGPPVRLVDLKVGTTVVRLKELQAHELPCDRPAAEEPAADDEQRSQPPAHDQHLQKHHHHQQQQLTEQRQAADWQQQQQSDQGDQAVKPSLANSQPPVRAPIRHEDSVEGTGSGVTATSTGWLLVLTSAAAVAAAVAR